MDEGTGKEQAALYCFWSAWQLSYPSLPAEQSDQAACPSFATHLQVRIEKTGTAIDLKEPVINDIDIQVGGLDAVEVGIELLCWAGAGEC